MQIAYEQLLLGLVVSNKCRQFDKLTKQQPNKTQKSKVTAADAEMWKTIKQMLVLIEKIRKFCAQKNNFPCDNRNHPRDTPTATSLRCRWCQWQRHRHTNSHSNCHLLALLQQHVKINQLIDLVLFMSNAISIKLAAKQQTSEPAKWKSGKVDAVHEFKKWKRGAR